MNLTKLLSAKSIYKNQFYFCIPSTIRKHNSEKYTTYIAPQNTKYLETNIMKDVKDLYYENYKILLKEIKDLKEGIFQLHELEDSICYNVNSSQICL